MYFGHARVASHATVVVSSSERPSAPLDTSLDSFLQTEIDGDDVHSIKSVRFYRRSTCLLVVYIFICFLTLGLVPLLAFTYPRIRHALTTRRVFNLSDVDSVLVRSNYDNKVTLCRVDQLQLDFVRFFVYRGLVFVLDLNGEGKQRSSVGMDSVDRKVSLANFRLTTRPNPAFVRWCEDSRNRELRAAFFGRNEIIVPLEANLIRLFFSELLHPYFLFQIFSYILWSVDEYFYYAGVVAFLSLVSIITTIWSLNRNRVELKKRMNSIETECVILASEPDHGLLRSEKGFGLGSYSDQLYRRTVSSRELVPGDIIEIDPSKSESSLIPCDIILLQGECFVNESILTGESRPILKTSNFSILNDNHILFSGTSLVRSGLQRKESDEVRVREDDDDSEVIEIAFDGEERTKRETVSPSSLTSSSSSGKLVGMVYKTAFGTKKGKLITSMLYERPGVTFQFYKDSFKFIAAMFILAVITFFMSLVKLLAYGASFVVVFLRAMDVLTMVVPPSLPIAIEQGIHASVGHLKAKKISCLFPQKINLAAKVSVMCFDKTGTLTEESLVLQEVFVFDSAETDEEAELETEEEEEEEGERKESATIGTGGGSRMSIIRRVLGCCHSLIDVDGEICGDPLEIALFAKSGFRFGTEDDHPNPSSTMRNRDRSMVDTDSNLMVRVLNIHQFESRLQRMSVVTADGLLMIKGSPEIIRCLSLPESIPPNYGTVLAAFAKNGFRVLACGYRELSDEVVSSEELREDRDGLERDIRFLGFLVVSNPLKEGTSETIHTLHEAAVFTVMVTGDNPRTGIAVALRCGILPSEVENSVILVTTGLVEDDREADVVWIDYKTEGELQQEIMTIRGNLAMTGKAFRILRETRHEAYVTMLKHCRVYARMSPNDKCDLVLDLKSLKNVVGFCGDGTNDCAAIKTSDCGISVSAANESTLVCDFSAGETTIHCCETILAESKSSLQTSFSMFKYIMMSCVIQTVSVMALYLMDTNMSDAQFLYADLIILYPVCILMGRTLARDDLDRLVPDSSLMSPSVVSSILLQSFSFLFILLGMLMMLRAEPWYVPVIPNDRFLVEPCYDVTMVFYTGIFCLLNSGVSYSISRPFKKSVFETNAVYPGVVFFLYVFTFLMMLIEPGWLTENMSLLPFDSYFNAAILVLCFLHFVFCFSLEEFYFVDEQVCEREVVWNSERVEGELVVRKE